MTPLVALLTGLGTGGLSCLAVQGGLLIGLLAKDDQADEQQLSRWQRLLMPVTGFLVAKLVVYTLFGLLLGLIGAKLQFSATALAWLQGLAAIFMIITGVRLIKPRWLPWLTITPPASVRRLVRRSAKSEALVAPVVLGALTLFIPCGTTLAVEAAALATGNPWRAAAVIFYFILGTAPLFFIIGILAKGTTLLQNKLKYVTAILVIGVGWYSFNAMLTSIDSPYSFKNEIAALRWAMGASPTSTTLAAETNPTITVLPNGYDPTSVTVPAGETVSIRLSPQGRLGCTSIFRIPKLGVQRSLTPGSPTTIEATFPQPGPYTYTCGMGMYSGTIQAI